MPDPVVAGRTPPHRPQPDLTIMNLLGIHFTLLIGPDPVAIPAPAPGMEALQQIVRMRLQSAWKMKDYEEAKSELLRLERYLKELNPSAARSLAEGNRVLPFRRFARHSPDHTKTS